MILLLHPKLIYFGAIRPLYNDGISIWRRLDLCVIFQKAFHSIKGILNCLLGWLLLAGQSKYHSNTNIQTNNQFESPPWIEFMELFSQFCQYQGSLNFSKLLKN